MLRNEFLHIVAGQAHGDCLSLSQDIEDDMLLRFLDEDSGMSFTGRSDKDVRLVFRVDFT
mgnify:CR=1 FL=1